MMETSDKDTRLASSVDTDGLVLLVVIMVIG